MAADRPLEAEVVAQHRALVFGTGDAAFLHQIDEIVETARDRLAGLESRRHHARETIR